MTFTVEPIGRVAGVRPDPEDDFWGGERARIELADGLGEDALRGLDAFSHVEVLFLFHEVDPSRIVTGARHPRSNPDWPEVGILAQRGKNRPNRIGSTICRLVSVEGRTLVVEELDATLALADDHDALDRLWLVSADRGLLVGWRERSARVRSRRLRKAASSSRCGSARTARAHGRASTRRPRTRCCCATRASPSCATSR